MKCEALNKFLDILGGHLHDKEAKSEIDRIKKLLDSEPSLQSCVEALCRTLSVIFSLPPHFSETFMEHLFTASGEVLALDSSQNKEQVWNTVEDYLAGKDVDRVNQCLIRSWLLWQTCNFKDAYLSIVEAYKIAISFGQRNKESWAQDICISICSGWARELGCKGMLRKAEAMFQEVLSLSPGYLEAWCDLGHICLEQGKVKDALDAFQQAVKLVPEYWVAHKGIAQAYRHLGQLDKAERVLLEYIKPDRKNAALLGLLGLVQTDLGKSLSAIRSYKEALSLNPNAAESWNNLGGEFEQLGLHKEAIRAYRQAISLEPHSWPESQNLIRCLIKTNRLAKACGVLQGYLATQVQRVKEEPLWVPRDFSRVAADKILSDRNLVVGSDSKDRPPGSGRHVVDHYLTVVQEMLVAGLKEQELDPRNVVQDLVHIGIRWCSYAQWLSEKRLSKDFARERLYAIKQRLDELCQKEAKKHGFYTAWPEIEARIGATSRVEFAQEIIRRESKWLKSASQKQERGETEDFRWVFKGNLWVHLFEYEQNDKPEHLERVHYYIELLKGHTILRKLVDPRVMGSSIDVEKWNRYINALPVKVERTAVVDLETCTKILPENAVGLSFYFLRRALLPELLLVFVFKPGQAPSLRIARNGNDRLEKFRNAARRLKQVHDQVAWQP
ncbi:MAG: tetratricopeptide repeat protein, partial [Desulfobacteraceae bacterium]|nr:tetratricopeptide repeat protein [Desulfobacteraceae bacterium]